MFSTLRRLFVLAGSAVASGLLFAPVAFAVNASDGAAGGPNPTPPQQPPGGSSLAAWQWALISLGIVAAVALLVAVGVTVYRRSRQATTLRPRTP